MRLNLIGSINGFQPLVEGQSSVAISSRPRVNKRGPVCASIRKVCVSFLLLCGASVNYGFVTASSFPSCEFANNLKAVVFFVVHPLLRLHERPNRRSLYRRVDDNEAPGLLVRSRRRAA